MAASTQTAALRGPASATRRIVVPLVLINLFVAGLISLALYGSYGAHRKMAEDSARNYSFVLEESLARFVDKVDLTLLAVVAEIEREKAVGGVDPKTLGAFLARQDELIPESLGFRVIDTRGIVTHGRIGPLDLSTSPTFRHARDDDDQGLFISPPVASLTIGAPVIRLSHRLTGRDGAFAGVVYAPVPLDRLMHLFTAIDLGRNGIVTVFDSSARVVARVPEPDNAALTFLPVAGGFLARGLDQASYHTRSPVDGLERSYYFRHIGQWPLCVAVGIADSDTLADWLHETAVIGVLMALFMVLSVVVALILHRDGKLRLAAVAELAAKEESLALFRQAIDRSNDAILIVELDSNDIVDFNQTACEQLGYERSELLGLNLADLDPLLRDPEEARRVDEQLRNGARGLVIERMHRKKDGSTFPVEISWRSVVVNGRALGISAERDITEKKQVEREMLVQNAELERANAALRESNADLERFAYVASHDLQTPLRSITSFVQLLQRRQQDRLDAEGRQFLGFIIDAARRMSSLIDDLLQYARITSQGRELVPVSARAALAEALINLSGTIVETGAVVEVGELAEVMADWVQLVSLFQNLVSNAIKYRHPDRPPRVSVTAQPLSAERWRFSVADNGIGVDPAYRHKIFEIFQRLDPGGGVEGTGVGLSMCERIVRRFGGEIWVESTPGEGSVFHFTLAAKPAVATPETAKAD